MKQLLLTPQDMRFITRTVRAYLIGRQHIAARVLALAITLVVGLGSTASAQMDPTQRGLLDGGVRYFNLQPDGPCGATNGADTILIGSDNAEQTYNFLTRNMGLQPHQAAGVMGNMKHESNIEPQRLQGTPSGTITPAESVGSRNTGWGIVQWTPASKFISRQTPLSRANELGVQLQFLRDQLEGKVGDGLDETQAGTDVKNAPTLEAAVLAFQGGPAQKIGDLTVGPYRGYERPADKTGSIPERYSAAKSYLAQYGSNGATPQAPNGSTTGGCSFTGNGEMVGSLALPLDRKWYDEHPDWFLKKHHSPPPAADIPVPTGTPVYSMTGGTVRRAPIDNGYGLGVEIDAGNGIVIKYAHGTDGGQVVGAKVGDTVKPGQRIMSVGSTGQSTGPHLHLEISLGGYAGQDVCPQPLLQALYENKPVPSFESLPTTGCF